MNKKKIMLLIALTLAFAIIGTVCFFLGRSIAMSDFNSERELNIKINLSELENLESIEGPIYVTGHKSPDSDTVGSSIAYAALLQKLGYDARPVVLGNINKETGYILDSAGVAVPGLLEDASGCNMILIDHSSYSQSADGLKNAYIVSIIDHHGDGTITTGNPLVYDARPLGSTATIIWIRYRNYGLKPDQQIAMVMLGSILSDTNNLLSSSTTTADREALKALSKIAGVSDTDAFYREIFKASLSYDGMTDEEIFYSDYKEYECNGINYAIGCINVYDEAGAKEIATRMKAVLPSAIKDKGMDFALAQISVFHDDLSITYLVPSDEETAKIIEAAYSDLARFDGTSYVISPGISRKKDLVPALTNILGTYEFSSH
ncbi:MAG: DHH family phosphoesterase [Butyrivibrio sp.]|nr:DHH family phosphoesterase [Butyrivibrio sp.]